MNSLIEKLNRYNSAIETAEKLVENDKETSLQHYIVYLKEQRRHIKTAISDENKVYQTKVNNTEILKAS